MKEFAVMKKIGIFGADVVRDFDSYADAYAFAILMKKSETNPRIRYFVASNIQEVTVEEQ